MTEDEMNALIAERDAEIEKLKSDKHAALGEKNKANAAAKAAQEAADTASEEAQRQAGDIAALEKTLTDKHAKALAALQANLDTTTIKLSGLLIDDTITKSLVENNVPKHMHAPLTAMFKQNSKLVDGIAIHGDSIPLADHLPSYFKSDEGKAFVTAPTNIGTGSTGVRNASADAWANPPKTPDEQYRFARLSSEDPATFNNLCDRFGMPDRKV